MPREIDFYFAVWKTLPVEKFDIIVDNYTAADQLDKILKILIDMKLGHIYLSDIIKNKYKYKAVLATKDFQMRYRAYKPKGFNAKRDLSYRKILDYKTLLTRKLINLGLLEITKKILRKPNFGYRVYREWNFVDPDILSDCRIMFPRGIDLDDHEPETCNEAYFTEFFCHGKFDEQIYKKAFGKSTTVIGYPRYDYHDAELKHSKQNPKSVFGPVKVLWMGSMHASGLELWLQTILTISSITNFTYRPHPKSVKRDTEEISYLQKQNVNVNLNESENLLNLFAEHDVVVAEWGDSIFSSIYNGKTTVLAEIPEYGDPPDRHGLYELVNSNIPVYSLLNSGTEQLIDQIKFWVDNPELISNNETYIQLRRKLFGELDNEHNFSKIILSYLD